MLSASVLSRWAAAAKASPLFNSAMIISNRYGRRYGVVYCLVELNLENSTFKICRQRLVDYVLHHRSHTAIAVRLAVIRIDGHNCGQSILDMVGDAGDGVPHIFRLGGHRPLLFVP